MSFSVAADSDIKVMNVEGEPLWQLREGDPIYAQQDSGVWRDFPNVLNKLVELEYCKWKLSIQDNNGVEAIAGVIYLWLVGRKSIYVDYKIYFDDMIQQREDGRGDPPRRVRRVIKPYREPRDGILEVEQPCKMRKLSELSSGLQS